MRLFGGPQGSKESWKPKQLRTYLPDRSAPGGRSLRRRAARRTRPPLPAWWRRSAARVPATGSGSPPPLPGPRRCRSRRCLSAALCLAGASVAGAAFERRIGRQAVAKWLLAPPTSSPGGGRGGRPARQGAEPGAQRAWCTCTPQPPHPPPHPAACTGVAGKCSSLLASRWSPQRRGRRHPGTADPRKEKHLGGVRDTTLHGRSSGNYPPATTKNSIVVHELVLLELPSDHTLRAWCMASQSFHRYELRAYYVPGGYNDKEPECESPALRHN